MNQFKKPLLRDAIGVSEPPAAPTPMATDADPGARASRVAEASASASASASTTPEHEHEPLWQASSFDLRSGADITDFSDTIPTELFDRWFKG